MNPLDVKWSTYIDFHKKTIGKSEVGDNVRISKYKNIFEKGYVPNWSEEICVIKKYKKQIKKAIKRKGNTTSYMEKDYDNSLTVGLAKKIMLYKNECFPPYSHSKNKIKVQIGLPNYPAKLTKKCNRCWYITIC